jgi:hypothetical protein
MSDGRRHLPPWAQRLVRRIVLPSPAEVFIPGERPVYYERHHLAYVADRTWPALLVASVVFPLMAAVEHPLALAALALVEIAAQAYVYWQLVEWSVTRVVVTNRRVFVVSGFFHLAVASLFTSQLTDFNYRQSFVGRVLDYGTVRLESPGQTQALEHIRFLKQAGHFYQSLGEIALVRRDAAQEARDAIVEELRALRRELRHRR